jgi:predicted transposase YdaD
VVYPFGYPKGEPKIVEEFDEEEQLRFRYREIPLKSLDAHIFTKAHAIPLYGLLPAMDGLSEELLQEAISDMLQYYQNREDNDHLRDELLCFQTLLQRAKRLPDVQIERVLRRIRMFDPLLEEDPWVQEYGGRQKAEGIAEGEARGKAEGEAKGIRQGIELAVQMRFPELEELAMERVEQIQSLETLHKMLAAMMTAQDERKALYYLQTLPNNPQHNA